MKKFRAKIALILVLSLTLAVAIPALAASTTKITGKYAAPTIQVVVPTTGTAVINPNGLPQAVKADDNKTAIIVGQTDTEDGDAAFIGKGQKVLTLPLVGYNASTFDLKLSASVTGAPAGELSLAKDAAEAATVATPTTKKSAIWFEVKQNDYETGADSTVVWYDAALAKAKKTTIGQLNGEAVVGALNAWPTASDYATAADTGVKNAKILLTAGTSDEKVMIAELTKGKTSDDGKAIEPQPTSIFFARLSGNVAQKPFDSTGKTPVAWTTKDGVTATITWTIELADSELN